ncbi:MAG: hypothetical protein M3164_08240 [Actinomycetota bacterium]|nr:hypothetical protein [Actinomycetota bacterium]
MEEPPDDAENARRALRALWEMSGQMEYADHLGEEERGGRTGGTRKLVGENFKALGDGGEGHLGFEGFAETNEPTFNRGEAVEKMRAAFRSQLALDGKVAEGAKPLSEEAGKRARASSQEESREQ